MDCCGRTRRHDEAEARLASGSNRTKADAPQASLLRLQAAAGNRAVAGLIQTKLLVEGADDEHERQADEVATAVTAPVTSGSVRLARPDQRTAMPAPRGVEEGIRAARGSGRALPRPVRQRMEASLRADFTDVRIHTGGPAGRLNRQLRARAFTTGRDIFLGHGHDRLDTGEGRRLLAHELTHVVQQTGGSPDSPVQRNPDPCPNCGAVNEPGSVKCTSCNASMPIAIAQPAVTAAEEEMTVGAPPPSNPGLAGMVAQHPAPDPIPSLAELARAALPSGAVENAAQAEVADENVPFQLDEQLEEGEALASHFKGIHGLK